jgi:hypothetical protein
MALIPQPILDFSDKDFASLRLRLQGLARSIHPEWTDFNTANFGNIMLELFAFTGDMMSFYQDAQAREQFWPTVSRRISAIRLGRLINFTLPGPTPATGTGRLVLNEAIATDIPIAPGTRFQSLDPLNPLPYRSTNTETLTLIAGATTLDIPVEQAELITNETFESTGAPNQEFILNRLPYMDGSAEIIASNGTYTAIVSFLDIIAPDTRKFVELVDQNDRAHIRFGNGILGVIPQGAITIRYKITRGVEGNIEIGQLGEIIDPILDVNGAQVSGATVTNLTEMSGGADRMSVAQARSLAPASLRALSRSVTKSDFETHGAEVSGVARVVMLTKNEDSGVSENTGIMMVVARGARLTSGRFKPATPSPDLLASVENKVTVEKPATITFQVSALAAPFLDINVSTSIHFENGADKTLTAVDVADSLENFFAANLDNGTANPDIDFGANILNDQAVPVAEIAWSNVLNAVRDVVGVRRVDDTDSGLLLNSKRQSVVIGLREFPRLKQITVRDASNNATLLSKDVSA